ncbi:MAG: DNA replication/repair protein RecF [Cytophagales bacterium]|nr:DNA replication/repair protein RecF [Bernardetiaceae bacterium]MDW8209728.1 DNA replication/repair protein RecF [Cytophagales bacterium]
MYLKALQLLNFKNYSQASFDFAPTINGIVGKNGSGKTNLLDAIYYLCLTKSAFHNTDQASKKFRESFFVVEGIIEHQEMIFYLHLSFSDHGGKILKINQKPYSKLSQHIGKFPCVLVTPYDSDLVREGSEVRRRFFDTLLCQINKTYLEQLVHYNRLLQQRNALLKQIGQHRQYILMLETYDEQLAPLAHFIAHQRAQLIDEMLPIFLRNYQLISQSQENASLSYCSVFQEEGIFVEIMKKNFQKDLALQHTSQGIHRDDFIFEINGNSLRKFASQGQQKSYTLALRLAQFEILTQKTGIKPFLLLDDIFDKLDDLRIKQLMRLISSGKFGQIFITDARPERTETLFHQEGLPINIIKI